MQEFCFMINGKTCTIRIEKTAEGNFTLKKDGCENAICVKGTDKNSAEEIIAKALFDKNRYDATVGLKSFCQVSGYDIISIHDAVIDFEYCEKISKEIDEIFSARELARLYKILFDEGSSCATA